MVISPPLLITHHGHRHLRWSTAPPDAQRRICWVLELCSCPACARHAPLL